MIAQIKNVNVSGDSISVMLWGSDAPTEITMQQYQAIAGNGVTGKSSGGSVFGIILMVIGGAIALNGFFMDTTVQSGLTRVNNLGLMSQRSSQIQIGGFAFVAGAIVHGMAKKERR